MTEKLGICVTNKGVLKHLLGIVAAAVRAGKKTDIFLTGGGVHLTQDKEFPVLLKTAGRVGVCEVSYISSGYKKAALPGLVNKDFVTQLRNVDMVEKCGRYIVI